MNSKKSKKAKVFWLFNLDEWELRHLLRKIGACGEAIRWAKGKDLYTAWNECPDSNWLLYLLDETAYGSLLIEVSRKVSHVYRVVSAAFPDNDKRLKIIRSHFKVRKER